MTRGQLKRLLIASMAGMLVLIIIMSLSGLKEYEVEDNFAYPLFSSNMSNKEKVYADEVVKDLKSFFSRFNAYSAEIDYSKLYKDSIEMQVAKSEFQKKMSNSVNKPYIDEIKKYFNIKVVNIFSTPTKEDLEEVLANFGIILKVEYVDLIDNYKIFKNKQYSNEIDNNIPFIDYLKVKENVVISTKVLNNVTAVYNIPNQVASYNSLSQVVALQIPVANSTENIAQQLEKITYDISSETLSSTKEKLERAKTLTDEIVREITEKKYTVMSKEGYSPNLISSMQSYMYKFIKYYSDCDLVKFVEDESSVRFVGYNNMKNMLVYELEEYPYPEITKVFKNATQSTQSLTKANNFELFKRLVKNNQIKKTKRIIEIPLDEDGLLAKSLFQEIMPSETHLWNTQELEFSGLTSVKPSELPNDYSTYFAVQPMSGIGNNIVVVYVPKANMKSDAEYRAYVKDKISKTLEIVLGGNREDRTEYYKLKLKELEELIIEESQESNKNIEFSKANSALNNVSISVKTTDESFTLLMKCNNWEVSE